MLSSQSIKTKHAEICSEKLMPVTLRVKSEDSTLRTQRETIAQRVLARFLDFLPASRLLCFLDDVDSSTLKRAFGAANRGLYGPIRDSTPMPDWPEYVTNCIFVGGGVSLLRPRMIDDLVYIYGSAWTNEAGATMTLAHELQHAIQHANVRKLWAVNSLIRHLPKTVIECLRLEWADIPIEREARIVAKRIALDLCGERAVIAYIQKRIAEAVEPHDTADWLFMRDLTASSSVDLVNATRQLFHRLRPCQAELYRLIHENDGDPDFTDIDLETFF
jgi:hypothetical protein